MRELPNYFSQVGDAIKRFPFQSIIDLYADARDANSKGRTIFIAGNGGNATIADHFALGMSLNLQRETGRGCRAYSLSSGSMLSAAANDFGEERMFSAQLEALARRHDLFIALSASGKSKNISTAVKMANKMSLTTCAIVGRRGVVSLNATDKVILDIDDAAVCEDVTMMLLHWLYCSFMEKDA